MSQNLEATDINRWRSQLGLFPVPLFSDSDTERRFVLLNGTRGNFCLDFERLQLSDETRNLAWSSNVGHYVGLVGDDIEVQRWDQNKYSIERYVARTVFDNLEKFHAHLERESPKQELSVISHVIQTFRRLRSRLGSNHDGSDSLKAFLYLLACATDQTKRGKLILAKWMLSPESADIATSISDADWQALQDELLRGRPIESLVPNLNLVLRHAAGQLFQEAHYEAIFIPQEQLAFDGFLPTPVAVSKVANDVGLHYTPPALARTLVEESLSALDTSSLSLTIFDPACGSGEFLREALRQLKLQGFIGTVKLTGWDNSEAACDMARFVLAWETRGLAPRVTFEIQHVDSLNPDTVWPKAIDIVLMNPPFVSWEDMDSERRKIITQDLDNLAGNRPDMAHAFLWKAASCLRDEGVIGSILPASILDGRSAENLRKHLSEQMEPRLIARLGSPLLFPGVTIDAAFYVARKQPSSKQPTAAFWADYRASSSSEGFRALRKIRYLKNTNAYPIIKEGYSIYLDPTLGRTKDSWAPRPYKSWKLLQSLSNLPKVKDIFEVMQGIRTGNNSTFLLATRKWQELPKSEQKYFRPAIVNKSIRFGFLINTHYVFYPYGELEIPTEGALKTSVNEYYKNYLLPIKASLIKRPGINPAKWWELTRYREWQQEALPKLVSTSFGDSGSFAWDESGEYVVVQGWGWIPKNMPRSQSIYKKISLAYLVILNSSLFSSLLSATSTQVAGGQWDLSKKFVSHIAIPNLFSDSIDPITIAKLSEIGKKIHAGLPADDKSVDKLVNGLYGINEQL